MCVDPHSGSKGRQQRAGLCGISLRDNVWGSEVFEISGFL